jgi:dTDP-4-dehydrorhamnose 3,5-epimerase
MINKESETFIGFGEFYFSKINQGVVKAWKYHKEITQNFCVPYGRIKLVFWDERQGSPSLGKLDEVILDDSQHYQLLTVPPGLWYGFTGLSDGHAILANLINQRHDPAESLNVPVEEAKFINYQWTM